MVLVVTQCNPHGSGFSVTLMVLVVTQCNLNGSGSNPNGSGPLSRLQPRGRTTSRAAREEASISARHHGAVRRTER